MFYSLVGRVAFVCLVFGVTYFMLALVVSRGQFLPVQGAVHWRGRKRRRQRRRWWRRVDGGSFVLWVGCVAFFCV